MPKKVQSKIIGGNVYGCLLGEGCGQGNSYRSDNGPGNHNDMIYIDHILNGFTNFKLLTE